MNWIPEIFKPKALVTQIGNQEVLISPVWVKDPPKKTWGGDDFIRCMRGKKDIGYIRYHCAGSELSLEMINFTDKGLANGIKKEEIKKTVLDAFNILLKIMEEEKLEYIYAHTIISEPMKNLFIIMGAKIIDGGSAFSARINIVELRNFLTNLDIKQLKLK